MLGDMNNATTANETVTFGKVTMYLMGGLGMVKVEAKECEVRVAPCAQYSRALHVTFKAPRQRNARGTVLTYKPTLLVLEGWGHPDPDSAFGEEQAADSGCVVSRSRYSSCDPRWASDFDAKIGAYIERTGAKVAADYRGHDAH
jgi:hypothetical protein